jgi:mannose-6-phosphate isomerase-like protein (cupin superfamily)
MARNYYKGNYADDSRRGVNDGWIVGTFMEVGPRQTGDVEIKYWEYGDGPTGHLTKESGIIEVTFILKGKVVAEVDGDRFILSAGDYIVIQPNTRNNTVVEILSDAIGLTVKAPSIPTAKKIIS